MSAMSETLDAYDAIAADYEEYSESKKLYLDAVDTLVLENIPDGTKLLDIGAGDGRRLAKIKNLKTLSECVAVEPSKEMAKICRERTGYQVSELCAEDLDQLKEEDFDVITALWNVFGHIENSEKRLNALVHIRNKLASDGIFIMDVNNRHNAMAYGTLNVIKRIIVDTIDFKESRGDAHYDWKIGEKIYSGFGHLFTPTEIEKLFNKAGLKIKKRVSLNYQSGQISQSPYKGQLFYILERA